MTFLNPTAIDGSLRRVWRNAGTPTDGTSGTNAGSADPGDLLIDTTNTKLYQNINTKASPTWSQVAVAGVAVSGDFEISGDITLSTEDVSVAQGKFVYLDGQAGGEYITSDTANDLMISATTNILLALGGIDEVKLAADVLSPAVSDECALGSGSLMWSDLFLASSGVINFNAGDVTITHAPNALAFAGAISGYTFDDLIGLGTSVSPMARTYDGNKALAIYTTRASIDGDTSYEPVYFYTTMTGAGQVGGRVACYLNVPEVELGDWANAFKARVTFGDNARLVGLASAACLEVDLPNGTIAYNKGTYFPLELEVNPGASTVFPGAADQSRHGFIYMSVNTNTGDFDDNAFLFDLQGVAAGTGHLLKTGASTGTIAGSLRCAIAGTAYYIPLWSNEVQI